MTYFPKVKIDREDGATINPATSEHQVTGNTNLGAASDAMASSDIGTFSLISLFKRLLTGITTLFTNQTNGLQKTQVVDFSGNLPLDLFGRTRIAAPQTVFDSQLQYGKLPLIWEEEITGVGASSTHVPQESSVNLTVGIVSGERVIRQSKEYHRYQPGKTQNCLFTGVFGTAKTNVVKRIGLFYSDNGLFFEQDGSNFKVVRRSFTSGSVVDTTINQSAWNIDKMDGTGSSGITLDVSKTIIYSINFQWLGVGDVVFLINVGGTNYPVHRMTHSNIETVPYIQTANLPVTYEIFNSGITTSPTTLKQICCAIISEGGDGPLDKNYLLLSKSTGGDAKQVDDTLRPLISIRVKTLFNGITNRQHVRPFVLDLNAGVNSLHYVVLYNATHTAPVWTDVSTGISGMEYDTQATAVSGGLSIQEGYLAGGATLGATQLATKLPLTLNMAGTLGDTLTIAVKKIIANTTATGAISWKEYYL